uniref:Uncharacterized protein n=1 Tax=Oryza rufipogon TaxID=4529 RepID=A0A0E0NLM2_ORYRU
MAWMTPDPWISLLEEEEEACVSVNKRPKGEDTVTSDGEGEAACANKRLKVEATVTSDGAVVRQRHEAAVAARGYGDRMPFVPQPFLRVRQITEMPDRYRFLDRFTDEQLATMPESLHATLVRIEGGFKKSWVESELRRMEMYKNVI